MKPTAYAVGYSLAALRACSLTVAACFLCLWLTGCGNAKSDDADAKPTDSSEIANGITTKVSEVDRDKDGKPDSRFETFYRGDVKVMMLYSRADMNGRMRVSARTYFADGSIVLSEGDDDGDGVFETIITYHPETRGVEAFHRAADGTVQPASTQVVSAHENQMTAVAEFFQQTTEVGVEDGNFENRFRAAQEKIQEAQRVITEGK